MSTTVFATMAVMDLIDAFASNEPVPGGGSASALAGAVGTALLMMVSAMPKTKSGRPEETADLAEAEARLRPLRNQLTGLIDRDSDAYQAVMGAFRLAKSTEEEKAARKAAIQTSMRRATEVPLEVMRACRDALADSVVVARNGNPNAASDVGVAIELLTAAVNGAALNVNINLEAVTDAAFVTKAKAERSELERAAGAHAGRARQLLSLKDV
jgi:formiminotetrahydrofolate cyclodeaminase